MSRRFDYLDPSDELFVGSVEDGNYKLTRVTIREINWKGGSYKIKASSGDHEITLLQVTDSLYTLQDESRPDQAFRVLGIDECPRALGWEIITSLLHLDYSPVEAVDFVAILHADFSLDRYADLRDETPLDLRARLYNMINELEEM